MIKGLTDETTEMLKSHQYIQNTYTIVKEMVENSLDAKSNCIKIHINESCIRIDDNGIGIEDLTNIGKKGYTSKQSTSYYVIGYNEVEETLSCGYRGIALCAIKNIGNVKISTKHAFNDSAFSKNLNTEEIKKCARERGTTILITDIFKNCPLRQKLCKIGLNRDLKRICNLLESYAMIYKCTIKLKHKDKEILNLNGYNDLLEYCSKTFKDVQNKLQLERPLYNFFMYPKSEKKDVSRIFYKGRVVHSKKISKELKQIYNLFYEGYPTFFLELKGKLDFNISPDKTEILIENDDIIVNKLKQEITNFFSNQISIEKDILHTNKPEECYKKKDITINPQTSQIKKAFSDVSEKTQNLFINKQEIENFFLEKKIIVEDKKQKNEILPVKNFKHFTENKKVESFLNEIDTSKFLEKRNKYSSESVLNSPNSQNSNLSISIDANSDTLETIFDFIKLETNKNVSTILEKSDFSNMSVIGQFNKGFILVSLQKKENTFLILLDQHASDEIFNYETISQTTKIKKQKLVIPYKLSVSSIDELFIKENSEIFKKQGFEIYDNKLITVPVFQNVEFGITEFMNLLENIKNGDPKIDRIHDVVASKACRMSIMVGEHLAMNQMQKIITNLGSLKNPWKCPHGRPILMILDEI